MRSKPYMDSNPHEPTLDEWDRLCRDGIKLDIGCGEKVRPNHYGIDRIWGCEAFPLTWADGTLLPDEIATEIVASHVLEHFGIWDTHAVLTEWMRVLKPGGVLRVAVPDFGWIHEQYTLGNPNQEPLFSYLMGGQRDPNDFHKSVFNEYVLEKHMLDVGLKDICHWESTWCDCAALELSLNLQGTK